MWVFCLHSCTYTMFVSIGSPWIGVNDGCEPPNPGPLQEQVPLATDPPGLYHFQFGRRNDLIATPVCIFLVISKIDLMLHFNSYSLLGVILFLDILPSLVSSRCDSCFTEVPGKILLLSNSHHLNFLIKSLHSISQIPENIKI